MTLPPTLDKWLNVTTIVVLSGFTAFQLIIQKRNDAKRLADSADDRLINLLKTTVEALEKKVKDLEQKFTDTLVELTKIRSERDVMAAILQGRDSNTAEMNRMAIEAMKAVKDILAAVTETNNIVKHRIAVVTKENI